MSGKLPGSYAERNKTANPYEALERRVDLVAVNPLWVQEYEAFRAEIREATANAARSYEAIFKGVNNANPGSVDVGRCIASIDALQVAKNTAFDAINLHSIVARPIVTDTLDLEELHREAVKQ